MFGLKKYFGKKDPTRLASMELRLTVLEGTSDYYGVELSKHETAAGGGFWKTAKGHLLRIRDMSEDHIKRCLAGGFAKPNGLARRLMEKELLRRKEEDFWRSKPMPGATFKSSTASTTNTGVVKVPGGDKVHIGDMSTDYIKSLLRGRVYPQALAILERELRHREDKPEKSMAYVGSVHGVPIYVANETSINEVQAVGLALRETQ